MSSRRAVASGLQRATVAARGAAPAHLRVAQLAPAGARTFRSSPMLAAKGDQTRNHPRTALTAGTVRQGSFGLLEPASVLRWWQLACQGPGLPLIGWVFPQR